LRRRIAYIPRMVSRTYGRGRLLNAPAAFIHHLLGRDELPREGAIIFSDLIGNLDVLYTFIAALRPHP